VPGAYRATLALPGGETPFGLVIAQEQQHYILYLLNGAERTRVSNVDVKNRELTAILPGDASTLHAQMHREGLEGSVTLSSDGGKEQVIPFKATRGDTWRFDEHPLTDNADVAGRWEVTFTAEDGRQTRAVGLFEQRHDRVTGTVMTPSGDHRFLEGQVHGDDVRMSTFAGGPAYLYKLHVNDEGELQGEYWQGLAVHEKVAARRNDQATLESAAPQTATEPAG
jgi:hypothetical protein